MKLAFEDWATFFSLDFPSQAERDSALDNFRRSMAEVHQVAHSKPLSLPMVALPMHPSLLPLACPSSHGFNFIILPS